MTIYMLAGVKWGWSEGGWPVAQGQGQCVETPLLCMALARAWWATQANVTGYGSRTCPMNL